ncbi:V-type ATPase subunit [Enterococcus hulanensis]|uniref:V-type ATPase subunit n=1 Tax=Enterococcus hulanensis TaxID=2559929 RepID=A0ABU3F268_9ENTE|nr:V-type ATPase subunit [Enterococcus hulanensis]MDT2601224.1 V-type ATPase subunit [Enterococcus hulanensis]MDT2610866.1 V-type ATPase subunit [Enterococcus hulanensis]MDT2618271.1 V-type ATPase subunit [Enterococcus hulanensis]MDT2629159.1 V-type ATPase subunit [Enterococcus hulanensis]MDT2656836.1 V-type ATPase subunit [Enterococcus hulanensis]
MKQSTYHELNPLVRLKELDLLAPELMARMIKAEDLTEVEALFRGTIYGEFLSDDFYESFEEALGTAQDNLLAELVKIIPDPNVIWIYTMRFTFHNLKALIKADLLDKNFDELYIYDGFYSLEQIKTAIRTGQASGLPDILLDSIREVREHFEESNSLQGIDIILDRKFLYCQRKIADTINEPELTQEVISFIDFTNILMTARGIKQKRSRNFMSTALSSQGIIPKEELLDCVEVGLEKLISYLRTTTYNEIIEPIIEDNTIDLSQLERLCDDYLTSFYETAQTQAFGPLPVLALLNAKAIETKNLRLIITGKRVGLTDDQIRERMRETYGT